MCEKYLKKIHSNEILNILRDKDPTNHFSVNINVIVLHDHDSNLLVELLKDPEKCIDYWNNATLNVQILMIKNLGEKVLLKSNVYCRFYNLPALPEFRRTIFPGNDDVDKFLEIKGTVMRMSVVKVLEYQRNYICTKCKQPTLVKAEYDKKYIIKQPKKCKNPDNCNGTNLIVLGELDSANCKDYQEIKIQEQTQKLELGSMPSTMLVTLEDDLVDSCKPGDSVTICGILKRRWGEFSKGCKMDIDIVLKANNIQVDNNNSSIIALTPEVKALFSDFWKNYSENQLVGRDFILKLFCPQIYGLYLVKLAIAVTLCGGSHEQDLLSATVPNRSEPHLLLVGDPGTGKSHLIRFASKLVTRSVLTTGVGSTAAGLTVMAVMEQGEWHLEAGALVLSDGGICCIDEFNSMKEHDRTSIHEAMEQQTISIAKASIVCKLNTRCSVLAACNPKGPLNPKDPLSMNIALPSPLLSRFDLILMLRDTVNKEWDTNVADYIFNFESTFSNLMISDGKWSFEMLQSYFIAVKKLNPTLSNEAKTILSAYYQMQRRINERNKARTTVRLLESLVRLSQGHAKLMFHDEVQVIDSIYAIILIDTSMEKDSSILNLNVATHSMFPKCPQSDYCEMLNVILNKLGLNDILSNEMKSFKRTNNVNIRSRFFNTKYNTERESKSALLKNIFLGEKNDLNCLDDLDINQLKTGAMIKKNTKTKNIFSNNDEEEMKINCNNIFENNSENKDVLVELTHRIEKSNKIKKYDKHSELDVKPLDNINLVYNKSQIMSSKKWTDAASAKRKNLEKSDHDNYDFLAKNSNKVCDTNKIEIIKRKDITLVKTTKKIDKNNFKKYKFLPKDAPKETKIKPDKQKVSNTRNLKDHNKLKNCFTNVTSLDSDSSIKNDLDMLKFMPSVNDDLNIDFDMDWDYLKNSEDTMLLSVEKTKKNNVEKTCLKNNLEITSSLSQSIGNMFQSQNDIDILDLDI